MNIKKDWTPQDGLDYTNLNRIEGNIETNKNASDNNNTKNAEQDTTLADHESRIAGNEQKLDSPLFSVGTFTDIIHTFPSSSISGSMDIKFKGLLLSQLVKNGNFANGTDGWGTLGFSTNTVTNGILTNTADGTQFYPSARQLDMGSLPAGDKLFYKIVAKFNVDMQECRVYLYNNNLGDFYDVYTPERGKFVTLTGFISSSNEISDLGIGLQHRYVDSTTADGKVMEIKEFMVMPVTQLGIEHFSDELMKDLCNVYFEGLKLFKPKYRTTGKNLVDYTKFRDKYSTVTLIDNGIRLEGNYYVEYADCELEVGKEYTMSWDLSNYTSSGNNPVWRFQYTDDTYSSEYAYSGSQLTPTKEVKYLLLYLHMSGDTASGEFRNIQLERGTVQTSHEDYYDFTQEIDVELGRVPNGTEDELDYKDGKWVHTQKTKQLILTSEHYYGMITSLEGYDIIRVGKKSDIMPDYKYQDGEAPAEIGSVIVDDLPEYMGSTSQASSDLPFGHFSMRTGNYYLDFIVEKGVYDDTTAAEYINGRTVYYQLANYIITELENIGAPFHFGYDFIQESDFPTEVSYAAANNPRALIEFNNMSIQQVQKYAKWLYQELTSKNTFSELFLGDSNTKLSKYHLDDMLTMTNTYGDVNVGVRYNDYAYVTTSAANGFIFTDKLRVFGDVYLNGYLTTRMRNDNGHIEELGKRVYSPNNEPTHYEKVYRNLAELGLNDDDIVGANDFEKWRVIISKIADGATARIDVASAAPNLYSISADYGMLTIEKINYNRTRLILSKNNDPVLYFAMYYEAQSLFTGWKELYHTGNLPAPKRADIFTAPFPLNTDWVQQPSGVGFQADIPESAMTPAVAGTALNMAEYDKPSYDLVEDTVAADDAVAEALIYKIKRVDASTIRLLSKSSSAPADLSAYTMQIEVERRS